MSANLPDPKEFVDPNQPTLIYEIEKSWEEVISKPPVWLSNKFPPIPTEAKYEFLGHKLISPIAIAAGPASGKLWTDFYFKMGYGMVIQKTRRTVPRSSNKEPNIAIVYQDKPVAENGLGETLSASSDPNTWEKYKSMTNSFGNPSSDILTWTKELSEQRKVIKPGQILACSVTATTPEKNKSCSVVLEDDAPAAQIVETASDLLVGATAAVIGGADVIELNLACPNVTENPQEGEMFQNAKLVKYVLSEFKRRFPKIPVGIKFGVYNSKEQMKQVFAQAGDDLDYVSGINALKMTVLAKDGSEILPGRKTSGVCGIADQTIALKSIEWAAQIRQEEGLKYQILGGGGIIKPEDVDRYLAAGADMVQVAAIALADPLLAYKYQLNHL
ncbi:hypothetical protein HYW43_01175 [Candidatus Daviesbacteria bacterium]|nr:hypothetical protein [Candidatus Daviesbacteria bacterium]